MPESLFVRAYGVNASYNIINRSNARKDKKARVTGLFRNLSGNTPHSERGQ